MVCCQNPFPSTIFINPTCISTPMGQLKERFHLMFKVLRQPRYFVLAIFLTLIVFLASLLLANLKTMLHFVFSAVPFSSKLILIAGFLKGIFTASSTLALLEAVLLAVLVAVTFSILMFKIYALRQTSAQDAGASVLAVLTTTTVTTCPSCGISLLSLLGVGSAVTFLPFQGRELLALSILILFFSLYHLAGSLRNCNACKITLSSQEKKEIRKQQDL